MHSRNENFRENLFILRNISLLFLVPVFPFKFGEIPVKVVNLSLIFRNFHFRTVFPQTTENFHVVFVFLASSDHSSNSPKSCKLEKCFIMLFQGIFAIFAVLFFLSYFFLQSLQFFTVFQHQGVQNTANRLNHSNIDHRTNKINSFFIVELGQMCFKVLLETSVVYKFGNFGHFRRIRNRRTFLCFFQNSFNWSV